MSKAAAKTMPVGQIEMVYLIGCGGTGSILAEHLARLIAGFKIAARLVLFDGDTVEAANVARQNFRPCEIGQNKAEALGLRLAGQFGIEIAAHPRHLSPAEAKRLFSPEYGRYMVISCTDSLFSRKMIALAAPRSMLWLDIGNEKSHGQAVIGTTHNADRLGNLYRNFGRKPFVKELPNIAALNPKILRVKKRERKTASCADEPFREQGFGVNAMAALAGAVIAKEALVDGQIKTQAIYFNVSRATMLPRLIARDLFERWK